MTSTTGTARHPDVSEISDLTEGLLSPARAADLRQHLDSCVLCADVRTSLEEIRGLLGTLPGAHRMPADIAGRIDAALAAEALLDATAPGESAHVSRETQRTPSAAETAPADRPAGRPHAATGPGRRSHTTRRRRAAVLGAVFGAAAVGVSVMLFQSAQSPTGGASDTAKKEASASSTAGDSQDFSGSALQQRVQSLLAAGPAQAEPRMEKGPSEDLGASTVSPKATSNTTVPACVQQGTGRPETPLAVERGVYEGVNAYLLVMAHSTDSTRVQAYVVEAACVDTRSKSAGKLLMTQTYPRH
ncbi:hypothetical protein [Streptomyces sp. NPDC002889]|uniref:hypothetical protein n=1 Tax=Streptomyces sp. NPDC002889 TaxID=3364669 RepID=UPI00368BC3B5